MSPSFLSVPSAATSSAPPTSPDDRPALTSTTRRRRHRPGAAVVAVSVAAALVALAALTGLAACSSTAPVTAPTTSQIRTLLTAHAAAVRAHDRTEFAAGLAGERGAATFRKAQLASFANLEQLPFSTWRYSLAGRTDDRSAEKAATTTLGRPAVIYQVTLRYGFAGFDPAPTTHTLYWTFVRDGDRAVVAGDVALAGSGGASWRGPWDFGPVTVARGTSVLVVAHAAAGDLSPLVEAVDAAVPRVTAVWGTDWARAVVVFVPASQDELEADTVDSPQVTSSVAAATVSDGSNPISGAEYGLRLVVNPPALVKLSAVGRRITLQHEITHIATGAVTTDVVPRWLIEGFADYVGLQGSGQSVRVAAVELGRAVRSGKVPTALPADEAFDGSAAAQAYEEGWLACRLVAQRAGQAGLVRLYRLVGESDYVTTAVPDALRTVLHESVAAFTAQWRAYVRAQLG